MFHRIVSRNEEVPGLDDAKQTLRDMGLLTANADGIEAIRKEDERNVPRFLNRVLALDVARQNAIFEYYATIFDLAVLTAQQQGTFDEGVADIRAEAIRLAEPPRVIATDEVTGAQTTLYLLDIDRQLKTCSFEEADVVHRRVKGSCYYVNQKQGYVTLAVPSGTHTSADTGRLYQTFAMWRPEGARAQYRDEFDIGHKFRPIAAAEAKAIWEAEHDALPKIKTTRTAIIGGAILPLWSRLRAEANARLRVVRVTADSGQRIVGVQIDQKNLGDVLRAVGVSRNVASPEDVFDAVLSGQRVNLVSGMYLFRVKVHGEVRIELGGVRYGDYGLLERMGLFKELLNYSYYLFVPNERTRGVAVLGELLKKYPVMKTAEEVAEELRQKALPTPENALAVNDEPVDVLSLIVPVEPQPVVTQPEAAAPVEQQPVAALIPRKTRAPKQAAPLPSARPATQPEPPRVVEYTGAGQGLLF